LSPVPESVEIPPLAKGRNSEPMTREIVSILLVVLSGYLTLGVVPKADSIHILGADLGTVQQPVHSIQDSVEPVFPEQILALHGMAHQRDV
jgi:hypothetical protein